MVLLSVVEAGAAGASLVAFTPFTFSRPVYCSVTVSEPSPFSPPMGSAWAWPSPTFAVHLSASFTPSFMVT